jgi:hypothetical protein
LHNAGKIVVDGEHYAKQINIPIPCRDSSNFLRRADATGDGYPSDFGSLDRDANLCANIYSNFNVHA